MVGVLAGLFRFVEGAWLDFRFLIKESGSFMLDGTILYNSCEMIKLVNGCIVFEGCSISRSLYSYSFMLNTRRTRRIKQGYVTLYSDLFLS